VLTGIPFKENSLKYYLDFWDTTKAFHFPFGEMMITPVDFCMLNEVLLGANSLKYHSNFRLERERYMELFGSLAKRLPLKYNSFQ